MNRGAVETAPDLVVLDVDGTLLDERGVLSAQRAAALAALADVVPVIFATGKTWPSIQPLAARFGLAGPHVTCNGAALVGLDGTVEVLASLEREVADRILEVLHGRGIPTATYLDDGTSVAPTWDDRYQRITAVAEAAPAIMPIPDGAGILKVLSVVADDQDDDELRALEAGSARIQRTGPWFLEWNAPGASKGHGLQVWVRRAGVDLAHVVAVGDSENDVAMFEVAGTAVAVAGSSAAAVAAADIHLEVDVATWLTALAAAPVRASAVPPHVDR